jgi:hypothetical protein
MDLNQNYTEMEAGRAGALGTMRRDQSGQRAIKEKASREQVREVADRAVREHAPALDWLADK